MKTLYYSLRTLTKGRGGNMLSVVTLALGLLMSVFLFARVAFELSYDNFWRDADRLCFITTAWITDDKPSPAGRYTIQAIPRVIAEAFPEQVECVTTTFSFAGDHFSLGEQNYTLPSLIADTAYFATMGLDLLEGDPTDLSQPDVVFLSASAARQLFGSDNPSGKTLSYKSYAGTLSLLVRGIYRDIPFNTEQKRAQAILSFPTIEKHGMARLGWNSGGNFEAFVRLRSGADADAVSARLSAVVADHLPADSGLTLRMGVSPLRDQHLEDARVRKMIAIMTLLGAMLLLTAAFNYALTAISSLAWRAKAIGVHKCSGASGSGIFRMFMTETGVVILASLTLAALLAWMFSDKIEELVGVPFASLFDRHNLWAPLGVVFVLLMAGGGVPAALFARIPVTQVFRRFTDGKRGWKRALLVMQFVGAAFVVGMTALVATQYHYVVDRDRGYRTDGVAYTFGLSGDESALSLLRGLPYIEQVATANANLLNFPAPHVVKDPQGNERFHPRYTEFDRDFLDFMGMQLAEGHAPTGEGQLLVNRTFVKQMGWTDNGIGQRIAPYGTVTGILDSFSFAAQPADNEPVMVGWLNEAGRCVHVRLKAPCGENLRRLNDEMHRVYPTRKATFRLLQAEMDSIYDSTRVFRDITLLATLSALFIVLMGVLGYTNDEIRRRSKEIAIRKVNGAGIADILNMFCRETFWLSVPAVTVGTALSFRAGEVWKSQFRETIAMPAATIITCELALLLLIALCVTVKAWQVSCEPPAR
ncbi:MAG: ABC transporter permease, partial [Prevotellaceae bacterium]|nr:ABC transporter permease [Prevotellaceae bacterium]